MVSFLSLSWPSFRVSSIVAETTRPGSLFHFRPPPFTVTTLPLALCSLATWVNLEIVNITPAIMIVRFIYQALGSCRSPIHPTHSWCSIHHRSPLSSGRQVTRTLRPP
ncbi:hypothetical protein H4582DRAFT_1964504 [Lactarius indigo]|nr:hypothetical protein H4582DRAFT_1964504 [Lactarius indigo]